MCVALAASLVAGALWPAAVIGTLSILLFYITCVLKPLHLKSVVLQTPSFVTVGRLMMLSAAFLFFTQLPSLVAACVLVLALILDGVDGMLARRYGASTSEGALLDVEVDAMLVCLLALALYHYSSLSIAVVLAGALRYLYVLGISYLKHSNTPEPRRRYASAIAVSTILSMIAALFLNHRVVHWIVYFHCGLVAASFLRSYWFRWQASQES